MSSTRLHPLHTPKFVAQFVMQTGTLPGERGTGRTTTGLLKTICVALDHPHDICRYIDHHTSSERWIYNKVYITMLERLLNGMGLQKFWIGLSLMGEPPAIVISFGEPSRSDLIKFDMWEVKCPQIK